jgi:ADP-ribose pyrophosphatase YjhB (NUDIX family)
MDTYTLLDEVRAIARNGLIFATNDYDRQRYERLLQLTVDTYAEILAAPPDLVRQRLVAELGYTTLKVGADAAIFNELGEILLMDRSDGSGWCLPCGWVEPNEKPCEAAVRETFEETGLEVKVNRLVGVFTRKPGQKNGPHAMIAVVHLCDVLGGELTLSHEGLALRYWPIDEVQGWHATHEQYARAAYAMWRSPDALPAISN